MEDQKVCLIKRIDRGKVKKKRYHSSFCMEESVQLRKKRSVLGNKRRFEWFDGETRNHAVTTPTTMAANAPRALKTFLDPEFLLLLSLPLVLVLEDLELPEVLLGVPEEPPRLGVELGFG